MRILVISKRQYMSKDLVDDAYGRFAEIPLALAARDHALEGVCLSYRRRPAGPCVIRSSGHEMTWHSTNLTACAPLGLARHYRAALAHVRERRPDVIWACADAFQVIIGAALSRATGVPCVADLYDNFAAYGATRIPGVHALYGRALRQVAGVSCISEPLATLLRDRYRVNTTLTVLPNAANDTLFRRRDRAACRAELGLPADAPLVGTAGSLSGGRGIEALFDAWKRLHATHPALHLVLAGPRASNASLPEHPQVRWLGNLPHDRVPLLYGALDVAVICNLPSAFGNYCFPQKYFEILACGVPMVAARLGALAALPGHPVHAFYEPGDPASLAGALERCLTDPGEVDAPVVTWRERAEALEPLLFYAAGRV